jgi:hypothetical protein
MQKVKRRKSGSDGKISWTELYQDLTGVNLPFFSSIRNVYSVELQTP